MQTEEIKIHNGEWLTDALKRQGYENIPSNVILDKTLTGLGATHTELHSNRNSIIIEPNVPVIIEKTKGPEHATFIAKKYALSNEPVHLYVCGVLLLKLKNTCNQQIKERN